MSNVTGGELLARCLANEGVRLVFGLPCPERRPHGRRSVQDHWPGFCGAGQSGANGKSGAHRPSVHVMVPSPREKAAEVSYQR